MDGINDLGSHELTPLDTMNNSGLRMIEMIIDPKCYEQLRAIVDMNDFGS